MSPIRTSKPETSGENNTREDSSGRIPERVVTATALFDGHDASINLIRRLLQEAGAEVVHLGHNRSVREIVQAAIQEDAAAVAVSSYQGGHNEFFPYLRECLDKAGGRSVQIYGGGGGVILPSEVAQLEKQGMTKIFTPEDGRTLGLKGMVQAILDGARATTSEANETCVVRVDDDRSIARALTRLETGSWSLDDLDLHGSPQLRTTHVVGISGPGGAGKSSLIDELTLRLRRDFSSESIAILSVDPTKRRSGGALLGDRLRMNAIDATGVFYRSFATRGSRGELSPVILSALELFRRLQFAMVIVETAGIGQGASAILDVSETSIYVMTPEFGAPTQLEKIDMLDFADLVAVNKIDRRAGLDAVDLVTRQLRRLGREDLERCVIGTCAGSFEDPGVEKLYRELVRLVETRAGDNSGLNAAAFKKLALGPNREVRVVPQERENYLAEAAGVIRKYHRDTQAEAEAASAVQAAHETLEQIRASEDPGSVEAVETLERLIARLRGGLSMESQRLLEDWQTTRDRYSADELSYRVRGREIRVPLKRRSLSGTSIPRVALPRVRNHGDLLRFLRLENLPGKFPFTAGVFPLRREDEHPTRQFAGEGPPSRTNRRFHLLSEGLSAHRLSTAFDSVTLYGHDPDERPDIFGKIGESGVSVATLDDMKALFQGFDLCAPSTSVSMTINGPAPTILAMFFNAAIDQQVDRFAKEHGRDPDQDELEEIRSGTLKAVRGTVQADILKEDQAQNTCLFSTSFSLKMMGDVQEYFIDKEIRNFYSVSISGYHIAEAGANPISQLAFTLANGLTYVEYYRSRGMNVDDFVPNFSFFFSMGLDPEYSVIGRVARRIWAIVMRDRYGAGERGQKLKYHIQTSGRSLHAREFTFNDIRTTLQALMAYYDQCNSLHTNAYDEAVTTPTEESVRRAMAIQLIIQKELGLSRNENILQGSLIMEDLTGLVEEAVMAEFDRLSVRGGIPGAMESGYVRSKIQEESRVYEEAKHSGELPLVGINTFTTETDLETGDHKPDRMPVVRATMDEKDEQITRVRTFQKREADACHEELERLKEVARTGGNVFAALMDTVRHASLGQITTALFQVGGAYRRMM